MLQRFHLPLSQRGEESILQKTQSGDLMYGVGGRISVQLLSLRSAAGRSGPAKGRKNGLPGVRPADSRAREGELRLHQTAAAANALSFIPGLDLSGPRWRARAVALIVPGLLCRR